MKVFFSVLIFVATGSGFSSGVMAEPVNLVPNGDFEAGNTQFTSGYNFSASNNITEGQYRVGANPKPGMASWFPLEITLRVAAR